MTAIMSPGSSPATSPPAISVAAANSAHPALPPLITSPGPIRRSTLPRPMSHASKNRLSQYSTGSVPSRSRPPSHIFPLFTSSLPYTLVRDFAYPVMHPMHYGPPPESSRPPSGMTTPASEQRRLSDPPMSWDSKPSWESWGTSESSSRAHDLPSMTFADGPPWSEDEDLQSPVVSSRHRKHKSSSGPYGHGRNRGGREVQSGGSILNPDNFDRERGYYVGTSGDGSERYYINQGSEANGPGGEYVTYPADQARQGSNAYQHIADQQPRQYADPDAGMRDDSDDSSAASSPGFQEVDESRYSRDYQFTITSPDEEMHGKAVALFDFERENENELPLVEGQIIWVSYRHGQGWLVAEDPKTQESGLVPEQYVRLLRDIEGGMNSLVGQLAEIPTSPNEVGTPTQAEHNFGHTPTASVSNNTSNGYPQPVVSTFSTSSKDLDPYPQHLLGTQAGQAPPQVVHYHGQRGGSQANTPTLPFHQDIDMMRRGSQDTSGKKLESALETLPDGRLSASKSAEDDSKMDTGR
ncbi:sh3 domain-containing protein [Diplogelasinospora grovesii]|uniref:Sh3 domain-containing protein n=1 Tax=Diplogelasinospora grovesii TaxID=303347 RepID=A0AAN6NGJ6_9PEZI|nr:sh3 domain-containing protein [Diplogelasinospora grovesii]